MIWYKAIVTNNELQSGLGNELKNDFEYMFHQFNNPDGMAIYHTGYSVDQNMFYYISLPGNFQYDLAKIFGKYRLTPVYEPMGMIFQIIFGTVQRIAIV